MKVVFRCFVDLNLNDVFLNFKSFFAFIFFLISTKQRVYSMNMDIKKYTEMTGTTYADLARLVKVTPQAIFQYAKGVRMPRPSIAFRIVKATKNMVTLADLYTPIKQSHPKK